ncbi:MAG: carboxylesterase family protein [Phenylobacterium sp.]|uniref:carboxylesterase/lipase family protein n=1 Tax=Phenylobacterium sp. TaxID=1871053 RepID=UPI00271B21CD|nr:carboxylesterase family protein [Phenylobacterium sp.]MDO8911795.1 carboxylesterase family protein [Phenylobacterium sp.]MDP3099956.1 carboxylesterase family protein [Phenylobacterium sp.]
MRELLRRRWIRCRLIEKCSSSQPARPIAPQSEDCLFLNIWTPAADSGRRPVLVFLHGGGFSFGSGASPILDGVNLASRQDVVVVTLNHRLNIFGHIFLQGLGGGEFDDASNAGLLDCVQALTWLQENIAGFGGDPRRVTLFGQSGGAWKVAALMAMPAARGLFHRAIVESGAALRLDTPDVALERSDRVFDLLGVARTDVRRLQTVPVEAVLAASAAVWPGAKFNPVAGTVGQFRPIAGTRSLPTHPFDPTAPAISADVPLIIGSTLTEDAFFLGSDPAAQNLDLARLRDWVQRLIPGADAQDLVREYREANPEAPLDFILYLISSDHRYLRDTTLLAERKAIQGKAKVWSYLFQRLSPVAEGRWFAPHGAELPFVFDNLDRPEAIFTAGSPTPASRKLASEISGAWAAFARSGDPNHKGLAAWPPYDRTARQTMVFDETSRSFSDPRRAGRLRMLALTP